MKFFKSIKNIIFLMIIGLLVCAVALLGYFTYDYHQKYTDISARFNAVNADYTNMQNQRDTYAVEVGNVKREIESIKTDNQKLKSENEVLVSKDDEYNNKIAALEDDNMYIKRQIERMAGVKAVNGKVCYLTFDDGPSNNTLKILDILDNYGVRATFFVVGRGKLDYLTKMKDAGHTIALHSDTHDYSKMYVSEDAYFADLNALSAKVKAKIGEDVKLVRFPGGSSNQVSKAHNEGIMTRLTKLLPEKGYYYFDWNVDSGDASTGLLEKEKIVENVLNGAKNKKSICVLMHDTASKTTTVEALPEIIEGLWKMGYHFEVLSPETDQFRHGKLNN